MKKAIDSAALLADEGVLAAHQHGPTLEFCLLGRATPTVGVADVTFEHHATDSVEFSP